jgi:hypothetical protein
MKALLRLYEGSMKAHIHVHVARGSRGGGVRESEDGVGGREEVLV